MERKERMKKEGTRLFFSPFSFLGHDFFENPKAQRYRVSQIKISCSWHPFTLQRAAKGSA
jgi:hypothetical protein